MFTGIVEETGIVELFEKKSSGAKLIVKANTVLQEIKTGDSIAVNGVCQTVTEFTPNNFTVMISDKTLNVTNFKWMKQGQKVNLERALTLQSRLGGHIVSGHVDCTSTILKIDKHSDFYDIEFELPQNIKQYVIYKGSIAINGVSLTVAEVSDSIFSVSIIPHTFNNTVFKYLSEGDFVNIETDILGRYVEKLLQLNNNKVESKINMSFLKENGFI